MASACRRRGTDRRIARRGLPGPLADTFQDDGAGPSVDSLAVERERSSDRRSSAGRRLELGALPSAGVRVFHCVFTLWQPRAGAVQAAGWSVVSRSASDDQASKDECRTADTVVHHIRGACFGHVPRPQDNSLPDCNRSNQLKHCYSVQGRKDEDGGEREGAAARGRHCEPLSGRQPEQLSQCTVFQRGSRRH
eukprot:scaffold996_cov409-Prasinococcus_capsulatus_cf.AAC.17